LAFSAALNTDGRRRPLVEAAYPPVGSGTPHPPKTAGQDVVAVVVRDDIGERIAGAVELQVPVSVQAGRDAVPESHLRSAHPLRARPAVCNVNGCIPMWGDANSLVGSMLIAGSAALTLKSLVAKDTTDVYFRLQRFTGFRDLRRVTHARTVQ
jgi:hypothetical protein